MNKTLLLAALAAQVVQQHVEGFGPVSIRQLSVAENDRIRAIVKAQGDDAAPSEFGLRMLMSAVVDADTGLPVFGEEDLPALRVSAGNKINALIAKVLEVNGFRTQQQQEEAAKNSAATPSVASASA